MRTSPRWLMPSLTLVLFFGAIGVAQAAGWWVTSGREVVPAGQMTVDDLKGWMTLQEAADGLGVPAGDLVALVEAPEGSGVGPDTAFKDIEGLVPGFELTTYREEVQTYLDRRAGRAPRTASTAVPTAVPSALPTGLTTAPVTETPAVTAPTVPGATPTTHVPTATPTGTPAEAIRGSMTLREVAASADVALDRLLAEAGLPADLEPDTVLREIQDTVPGFEIQVIRDAVARLAD